MTTRKSLADRVKEDEAKKNDNSTPVVNAPETENQEAPVLTPTETSPPEFDNSDEEVSNEESEPELTDEVKARIATYGGGVSGNRTITHSGGGSVTMPAPKGANLTNTPSETALAKKTTEVEHVYAQSAYEVE